VSSSISRVPKSYYSVSIDFGCDPKRTEELTAAALKIVNDFRQNGPTDNDIADIETGLLRDFETASQDNNYLANQIESKYQYGDNVTTVWTLPQAYRRLDVATVERAAQRYLNTDNYVKVTLFPEK
jgi:zinc protease